MLLLEALASGRLSPAPHATEITIWIAHYRPDAYRLRPDCGPRWTERQFELGSLAGRCWQSSSIGAGRQSSAAKRNPGRWGAPAGAKMCILESETSANLAAQPGTATWRKVGVICAKV